MELFDSNQSSSDELNREAYSRINQHLISEDEIETIYSRCKCVSPEDKQGKHTRGYTFQNLIYSILYYEKLSPRTSYRPKGEEIDGAFYLDHRTFLLEAKWISDPISASVLYTLKGKVDGKLSGTLGCYFSMSGYSADTPDTFEKGKVPCYPF